MLLNNLHLHHNFAIWPPLRRGALALGSHYNPGATGRPAPVAGDTALLVEPELAIGAQARVFSRDCAAHILKEFRPSAWHQDLALARLAAELAPLHYHLPSLVEHLGVQSTWSGPQHRAMDFDPHWRRDL